MKGIVIYQDGGAPIVISDDDSSPVDEYSRKISALLESNNISILHTSTCSIIIRPNKISAISIEETNSDTTDGIQKQEQEEKEEIQEDVISD